MALSVLDCVCYWGDGRVCITLAAGYCEDAAINSLYVQGNEFDFCAAVFSLVVWRGHYVEQCHRGGDYYRWNCFICTMQLIFFPFYGFHFMEK